MSSSHIVMFKKSASQQQIDAAIKQVEQGGGKITHRYEGSTKGFAATIDQQVLAQLNEHSLTDDSAIELIEKDGTVTTQ